MEEGSDDRWPSRRRRLGLADLNAADEPDDTEEYYNNHRDDCSSDSEETISDTAVPASNNNNNGGGGGEASSSSPAPAIPAAAAAAMHACPFCWKEFRSHKAVCGHMKVHREQQGGIKIKIKKGREAKRSVAASTRALESDRSMAVVVAAAEEAESKIVLQPTPLAFAVAAPTNPPSPVPAAPPAMAANDSSESSSSRSSPKQVRKDATETVVVARTANPNPPTEAVLVHPHAAPLPPRGDRQSPKGYTCKKCGMWFRTHQGLGGHMVGHKNRELAPTAAAAVQNGGGGGGGGGGKPAKMHVCKECGEEFTAGVQLGGHMRKHWPGPPINKKPRLVVVQPLPLPVLPPPPPPPRTATVGVADGDLTLALPVKTDETPAPAPVPGRVVLLFGIDIGLGVQTPAAAEVEQGSSATVIGAHQ